MAKPLAAVTLEDAVEYALRDAERFGLDKGIKTTKLVRAMRRLGYPMSREAIAAKLLEARSTRWGSRFAYYVGGTNDPHDSFMWTIKGVF